MTLPTELSIENDVAFVVAHVSFDVPPPSRRDDGLLESVHVGAAATGTVTFAAHVVCPPGPDTVIV